jgi:hypothetical protein
VAETVYLTITRQQMLDSRFKAGHRDQPDAQYYGQRSIGYTEFKISSVQMGGHWHAIVVLADGTRVEIDEDRDESELVRQRRRKHRLPVVPAGKPITSG